MKYNKTFAVQSMVVLGRFFYVTPKSQNPYIFGKDCRLGAHIISADGKFGGKFWCRCARLGPTYKRSKKTTFVVFGRTHPKISENVAWYPKWFDIVTRSYEPPKRTYKRLKVEKSPKMDIFDQNVGNMLAKCCFLLLPSRARILSYENAKGKKKFKIF